MTDPTHPAASDLRRWPSDPALLVDTSRCPACFSPLHRAACDVCGLRLDVPAASMLLAAGSRVRDAEADRQGLITRMRVEQADRAPIPPPLPMPAAPPPTVPPVPAEPPTGPGAVPGSATGSPATDAAPAAGPRRSGVQVLLLTLGVVLLSVAAVVFLLVAYIVTSLATRSIITAIASVVVLGVAWMLRARRLPGTAEGVAAVAVVLLVLDVWIVRANGLFGTERLDAAGYWGGALLVVALLLAGARALSGVRVPGLAAAALLPVGTFLLAYGTAPDDEVATSAWLGGVTALAVGALSQLARPSIERTIVLACGAGGGAIAFATAAWALPEVAWGVSWAFAAVGAASATLLVLRLRATDGAADAWSAAAAIASGTAFALAPTVGAAIELDLADAVWITPAGAAAIACVVAAVSRARSAFGRLTGFAFVAAAVVAGIAAIPALVMALAFAADLPAIATSWWDVDASAPRDVLGALDVDDLRLGVILAPLSLAAASVVAFGLRSRLRGMAALPVALSLIAALAVAAGAPTLVWVVAVGLAVATAALVLAALGAVRVLPGVTIVLAGFGMPSAGIAWALAHGSVDLWWWAVPFVLLLAVAGRVLATRVWSARTAPLAGALHVAASAVLAIGGVAALPGWAAANGSPFVEPWNSGVVMAGLAGSVILGAAALARALPRRDRLAAAIPSFGAGAASASVLAVTLETPFGWITALALAAACMTWIRSSVRSMRFAVAAAMPFALAFLGAGLTGDDGRHDDVTLALAGAALLAAALAHVVLPRDPLTRWTWSVAVGAVVLVVLTLEAAASAPGDDTWLVLLLLAPVPLLVAALDGDPIAGAEPSRHLSWLSLALAVGSAWAWSARAGVQEVEPYTLPLAMALLAAGALITWRRGAPTTTAAGRTVVFAAAAAVAVLPSVGASGESELRTLVAVSAGTVAIIAALFLPELVRGIPVRLLVLVSGWTAVTGAGVVRGAAVALGEPSRLVIEFWPVVALVVGVIAAVAWTRTGSEPARLAEWALVSSVAAATIPTLIAILDDRDALVRAAVLVPTLAVLHIANAATTARPVGGPIVRWTSLAILAVAASAIVAAGTVDPFDVATVPVGVALLVAGGLQMRRDPARRSWPALGPGLAVILIPALIADWTDPELWRLVALGAVATAIVVVGAALRLQAPFVLGGSVLLVHAIVQLWPWIRELYEAVWWGLWLGIAGALLVAVAATYERQLRLARGAVRTIAALR
jgi:hypothetical protein